MTPSSDSLKQRRGQPRDVAAVCDLGRGAIGDLHPTPEKVLERLLHNPTVLWIIEQDTPRRIVGYTLVYPLSRAGEEGFGSGTIMTARDLLPQHIAASDADAAGLYVAMVLGTHRRSKTAAKAMLASQVAQLLSAQPAIRLVRARVSSPGGASLAQALGSPEAGQGLVALDAARLLPRLESAR